MIIIINATLRLDWTPTCRALEPLCVWRSGEGIIVWSPTIRGHLTEEECEGEDDGNMTVMLHDVVLMVIGGKLEYLFGLELIQTCQKLSTTLTRHDAEVLIMVK